MKLDELLKELKDTWDYTTEELNDIHDLVEKYGVEQYWVGYEDGRVDYGSPSFISYGGKEDW